MHGAALHCLHYSLSASLQLAFLRGWLLPCRLQRLPAKFSCDTIALISLEICCWIIELHIPSYIPQLKLLPAKTLAQIGLKSLWVKRRRSERCWWRSLKSPISVTVPNLLTFEAAVQIFVRVQSPSQLITCSGLCICLYFPFHYISASALHQSTEKHFLGTLFSLFPHALHSICFMFCES